MWEFWLLIILNLKEINFRAVVVFGLGLDFLFKSILPCCVRLGLCNKYLDFNKVAHLKFIALNCSFKIARVRI